MAKDKEKQQEERDDLFTFRLQDLFDNRYVLKEGDYRMIRAIVVGLAGLILSGVVTAALAFVLHAPK